MLGSMKPILQYPRIIHSEKQMSSTAGDPAIGVALETTKTVAVGVRVNRPLVLLSRSLTSETCMMSMMKGLRMR